MAMILFQPDLGTVLLFLPVLFAMLYAAGARGKHLLSVLFMAIISLPMFWTQMKPYQRLRITGVLLQSQQLRDYLEEHPKMWDALAPRGEDTDKWYAGLVQWESISGYQLIRSKMAIAGGGVFGHGWGEGTFVEFRRFLDEGHNDFIFAMIAHQWGLLGALLLLACYVVFILIGFDVAMNTNDPFGRLVAVGLSSLIAVQTLVNLCMTVGLGPITGVTLPFVSAGGSSLVASFLSLGLLISVAHHRPMLIAKPPFEFKEESDS
jgi:rod shape determining protein RodA